MTRPAIALLLSSLLLAGCTPQKGPAGKATPVGAPKAGVIVALGDSLTAGQGVDESDAYPAQLQRRLEQDGFPWEVANLGVSGETSSGARTRMEWAMRLKPHLVILESGANDGLRGIDPKVTEENLAAIIRFFKSQGVKVLLAGMKVEENLGQDYTSRFAEIYPRLALAEKVPLIPFFLEGVAARPELNQPDRIHPTAQGYARVVEQVAPQVESLLR